MRMLAVGTEFPKHQKVHGLNKRISYHHVGFLQIPSPPPRRSLDKPFLHNPASEASKDIEYLTLHFRHRRTSH